MYIDWLACLLAGCVLSPQCSVVVPCLCPTSIVLEARGEVLAMKAEAW